MHAVAKLCLAATGIAAVAGAAYAADRNTHVLNVVLPNGSVEHVHYVGDVAPRLILAPEGAGVMPVAMVAGGDPFAMMDRAMAEMQAQSDAMLRQVALLSQASPAMDGTVDQAAMGVLPGGTVHYSFTSYSGGDGGGCSQSVQVTSLGGGQAPKVVRQSAGDCSAMNATKATPAVHSAPAPAAAVQPAITPVRYEAPKAEPKKRESI